MRNMVTPPVFALSGRTISIPLVTVLLLLPPRVSAQTDQKDIVIAEQKQIIERLKKEIDTLKQVVSEREKLVLKLEANVKKHRIDALNFEATAKARQVQNENLLEQLRDITARLARLEAGGKAPVEPVLPKVNPPKAAVNGKIEKIDGALLQINVGKDHGVEKNHTLDVYRLQPEPKYLGVIRIIDTQATTSVARLVPSGTAARSELKVGDSVTSRLTNAEPKKEPAQ